eukprot:49816-Eustigmatos_ZCMA.PRE.1
MVNERFGDSYLVWNVSDDGVVTEVYQLLRRQICDVQWLAPGKSRMPCLEAAVRMCYSIKVGILHNLDAAASRGLCLRTKLS